MTLDSIQPYLEGNDHGGGDGPVAIAANFAQDLQRSLKLNLIKVKHYKVHCVSVSKWKIEHESQC